MSRPLHVVTLCTGNAARSVMCGAMLTQLAEIDGRELRVTTAGTHALEGQPMSMRTRSAIAAISELDTSMLGRHRSHQLTDRDCETADLIVAMEASHVAYVRRVHPDSADITATIRHLVDALPVDAEPLGRRVSTLELGRIALDDDGDVIDPAGGEQPQYDDCASELWLLSQSLMALLD